MPPSRSEKLKTLTPDDLVRKSLARSIEKVGVVIDEATDLGCEHALLVAVEAVKQLRGRRVTPVQEALLHYFEGNAWYGVQILRGAASPETSWLWSNAAMEERIVCSRGALGARGFVELDSYRRAQVLTNLGNAMSTVGRFVEAIEYWRRAMQASPAIGMPMASLGEGLLFCWRYLYDSGHRLEFVRHAYWCFRDAEGKRLEGDALDSVKRNLAQLEQWQPALFAERPVFRAHSLGRSKSERAYRRWCLDNGLYLNPMNVITTESLAARDVMSLPPMRGLVKEISRGRGFVGLFNAMKQEYVAARYLTYESQEVDRRHFADLDVFPQDTMDVRYYGFRLEQQKLAFRAAYSVLDKIGVFLNEYYRLDIPERRTGFRTVWYDDGKKKQGLRAVFKDKRNWPLRGLFWLSKDLAAYDESFLRDSLEPDAKGIADLRHALEHKSVRFVDDLSFYTNRTEKEPWDADAFAKTVTVPAMGGYAMRMLKKARAALIYLSMAVHLEEQERDDGGRALPIGGAGRRHAR